MKGHIRQRGAASWELKFDAGRDANGKRLIQYVSFKGAKREAQTKLAQLIAAAASGAYVEPNKTTVAEFLRGRIDHWQALGTISARTAQRYRQLAENQIIPHLGDKALQKLKPIDIDSWHSTLRSGGRVRTAGGLSPRTVKHAHRLLSKALSEASSNEIVSRNVAKARPAPKVEESEIVIVRDVPALLEKVADDRLFPIAILGLFAGMRLGEILAVRDSRLDFDRGIVQVREALEQTKALGIRFKPPKSKAGRRDITLPSVAIEALRAHRKRVLELRLQLGAGKLPGEALLFADLEGNPLSPNAISAAWADLAERIGMPEVTFHALRHTHASQLIDAGVDIVTISKRLGHAKPDITLRIYAHLFAKDDGKAAAAINAAFGNSA